ISGAIRFLVKVSVVNASSTRRPLIRSSTSRAFCGDTRVNRAFALNSIRPQKLALSNLELRNYFAGGGAPPDAGDIAPGPPGTPAGLAETSAAAFIECPLNTRVKEN